MLKKLPLLLPLMTSYCLSAVAAPMTLRLEGEWSTSFPYPTVVITAAFDNDLLLACHGARFTVAIRTQLENAKGEAREGFDIEVHDAETGDSKSLGLMSG